MFLYDVENPISMALVGDDLFWSSSKSFKLNWTPKHRKICTLNIRTHRKSILCLLKSIENLQTYEMSAHKMYLFKWCPIPFCSEYQGFRQLSWQCFCFLFLCLLFHLFRFGKRICWQFFRFKKPPETYIWCEFFVSGINLPYNLNACSLFNVHWTCPMCWAIHNWNEIRFNFGLKTIFYLWFLTLLFEIIVDVFILFYFLFSSFFSFFFVVVVILYIINLWLVCCI